MSHAIHTTDALVISLETEGEANIVAHCLTRDLGRIYLHVQGAKKSENKHRMMLFPLASVTVDCVEGKQVYRCTGVTERQQVYQQITRLSVYRRRILDQLFHMITRLVPVHVAIPEIFAVIETFFDRILDLLHDDQDIYISYLVLQLRILGILGYWNSEWSDDVLHMNGKTFTYVAENTKSVEKLIERIFRETQMTEKIFP